MALPLTSRFLLPEAFVVSRTLPPLGAPVWVWMRSRRCTANSRRRPGSPGPWRWCCHENLQLGTWIWVYIIVGVEWIEMRTSFCIAVARNPGNIRRPSRDFLTMNVNSRHAHGLGAIRKIQMNIFQVGAKGKPGYVGLFAWRWVKTTNLRFQSSTATSLMVWSSLVAVYMVYGGLWRSMQFSPKSITSHHFSASASVIPTGSPGEQDTDESRTTSPFDRVKSSLAWVGEHARKHPQDLFIFLIHIHTYCIYIYMYRLMYRYCICNNIYIHIN